MVAALSFSEYFPRLIPLIVTLAIVAVALSIAQWLFRQRSARIGNRQNFLRPLVMIGISVAALIAVIIALPIGEGIRDQLLGLLGLVLTGIIGLSSTTFVSNAMAGLMIRSVGSFRSGDYIKVEGYFGRVSERGLFHTEIQTEQRDLTTVPNLYLVSNPVKVVRSSGTIVSADVSLGYDANQARVETLLSEAAMRASLVDPFVQVTELGDYAVSYRVSGFLKDTKQLMTARSQLRIEALNTLHEAGVEVMSPSVMMQRPIPAEELIIPKKAAKAAKRSGRDKGLPERQIFDKAERAEEMEFVELKLKELRKQQDKLSDSLEDAVSEERSALEQELETLSQQIKELEARLERLIDDQ